MFTYSELRDRYANFFGQAAALYNLNPLLGRLYGYLVLSPEPLSLDDLVRIAGAAKSTVSVAMKNLEHYRVVKREWRKGDRRDYFVVRTDATDVLRELYQLFFSREMKYMQQANAEAYQALTFEEERQEWPTLSEREAILGRLRTLDSLSSMLISLLEHFLGEAESRPAKSIPIEVEE